MSCACVEEQNEEFLRLLKISYFRFKVFRGYQDYFVGSACVEEQIDLDNP